jgi:FtsZ-binding cell division protein ZapB
MSSCVWAYPHPTICGTSITPIAYDGAVASIPANRKSEIDSLIEQSHQLEAAMRSLQEDDRITDSTAHNVTEQYRKWHTSARRLLGPE